MKIVKNSNFKFINCDILSDSYQGGYSKVHLKDNLISGINSTYYKDGKLKSIGEYFEGVLNGVFQCFYPNGNLKYKCSYKHGKRHGVFQEFYDSGDKKSYGKYMEAKKYNNWVYYDKKGNPSFSSYDNGKLSIYI